MKNLAILLIGLITLSSTTFASNTLISETAAQYNTVFDGSKYIFVENGIEFSLFPDGEFDFYIPEYIKGINTNAGSAGISFNTGFDYNPYVQYDEYGAVIQIENTSLYYDSYGRLTKAGDVKINYRNNRINRVGNLHVHYNNNGAYSHYTGFINVYNRNYVFNPYHNFLYRPLVNRCLVYTTPYRRYYTPIRYSYAYHRNNYYKGYSNGYKSFRTPKTGRIAHNNSRRENINRNNNTIRSIKTTTRSNRRAVANNSRNNRNTRVTTPIKNRTITREVATKRPNTRVTKRTVNTSRGIATNSKPRVVRNTRPAINKNTVRSTPKRTVSKNTSSRTKIATRSNSGRSSLSTSNSSRARRR